MAEAVVSFAVERLADLLISEAKFLSGVKDKVLEIQHQLKEMQNFLKDAVNKRGNHGEVGKWVVEIRELALQTEDVLETYAVKVASQRERGQINKIMRRFACIIGECLTLHKIGSEIGTIQARITNLARSRQTFNIQGLHDHQVESSRTEEERQRQVRISYAHLIEKDFVGMEEEIKELILHLKNKDGGYEISVWGMGGQGKTTLVRKVYNHTDVRSYFQAFAWVCITQKLERQKVLQDILQGLLPSRSKDEIKGMGDTELVQELYKIQKELKCLVVIDDIWSVGDWETLKQAFPVEEPSGSKILLTTRNEEVANLGFPYKLRSLSDEEGWKLFFKKVFPTRDDVPEKCVEPKKEKLGREMVQQCQGLPLAISALGGLLKNKNSLWEWEMVKKDIVSNLSRGEGIKFGGVRHILGLSYEDLPFRLKQLFLYLGTFKEDEEIEAGKLYLLWIAEGMIPSGHRAKGEMLMDVAERYLVELAQRSLIQLKPMNKNNLDYRKVEFPWLKIHSCRLHDLIRDLCLSKGKEEDILKIIVFREAHNKSCHSVIGMEARRLAIHMYDDADNPDIALEQQHMVRQLRTLLFFSARTLQEKVNNLKNFKLVRVLKLDKFKFRKGKLPRGLAELIHLRYLSLKDSELEELPSCIGDLRYLETLDLRVRHVHGGVITPNVLWKMKLLKHLYLPCYIRSDIKKLRFDGLNELELLWNFDACQWATSDLMELTNLQVLDATTHSLEEQEGVMNFLNSNFHPTRYTSLTVHRDYDLIQLLQCENLNELAIFGDRGDMIPQCEDLNELAIFGDRGDMIPQPYEQHLSQSLTSIRLYDCNFEADTMVLLEKLPNLQRLLLDHNPFVGNEFVCTANSFPQLIHLRLWRIDNLEKWRVDEGAMPNLSKLEIAQCKKLEMFPEGLKFLATLRELIFLDMPKEFNDRVGGRDGVEGEDFHKVRHIPNILINGREAATSLFIR